MVGQVVTILEQKRCLFIRVEGMDYFAHAEDLMTTSFDSVRVGQQLEFDPVDSHRGPRASNVREVKRTLDDLLKQAQ